MRCCRCGTVGGVERGRGQPALPGGCAGSATGGPRRPCRCPETGEGHRGSACCGIGVVWPMGKEKVDRLEGGCVGFVGEQVFLCKCENVV